MEAIIAALREGGAKTQDYAEAVERLAEASRSLRGAENLGLASGVSNAHRTP